MEPTTFKAILTTPLQLRQGKEIQINKIDIPMIQRDFAYGRTDSKNTRKRNRFLDALYDAVCGKTITLDFVYGNVKDNVLTPLDGQQRLTTLYLLYWYSSKKENIAESEAEFLKRFSYETRPSARKFCEVITSKHFELNNNEYISKQIKDKNWFPLEWQHDATIASMLIMLDAIQVRFSGIDNLWLKLENISFYFLPIEDMGLTDELYIKMNSRGKPLTPFEHFKAEFEKQLRYADEELAKRIGAKIDREWTDFLWQYRNSGVGDVNDNTTDDEFLRYFIFICNIICYQENNTPKTNDEFDLIKDFFTISGQTENQIIESKARVIKNAETLERYFDCWLDENKKSIPILNFFASFASKQHEVGKIKTVYNTNFLEDCLKNYAEIIGSRRRKFTLNQIILLYAFILYRQNLATVNEAQFSRRLRIVNNLILNSSDQISDSEERQGGNRMPAILRQVDSVILNGVIIEDSKTIGINFNPVQIEEERQKLLWTKNNPDKAEMLYTLEDNELLYGQIAIVGLENFAHFEQFDSLFKCDWDLVDCALFTIGDYKQKERNGWRYQLGSWMPDGYAWKTLFHKSENLSGFENTKRILNELLSKQTLFTNDYLKGLIDGYVTMCQSGSEYPWIYYYIKYKKFRPGRYGKYWWNDFTNRQYICNALFQRQKPSENAYNPFLKTINTNVWREHWGNRIYLNENEYLKETQTAYQVLSNDENKHVIHEIPISQNVKGIDIEDRIEKVKIEYDTILKALSQPDRTEFQNDF